MMLGRCSSMLAQPHWRLALFSSVSTALDILLSCELSTSANEKLRRLFVPKGQGGASGTHSEAFGIFFGG